MIISNANANCRFLHLNALLIIIMILINGLAHKRTIYKSIMFHFYLPSKIGIVGSLSPYVFLLVVIDHVCDPSVTLLFTELLVLALLGVLVVFVKFLLLDLLL